MAKQTKSKRRKTKKSPDRLEVGSSHVDALSAALAMEKLETQYNLASRGNRPTVAFLRDLARGLEKLGADSCSETSAYQAWHAMGSMIVDSNHVSERPDQLDIGGGCKCDLLVAKLTMEDVEEAHRLADSDYVATAQFIRDVRSKLQGLGGSLTDFQAYQCWRRATSKMQEIKKNSNGTVN